MVKQQVGWLEAFLVYFKPRVLAMFFLGFSSGLPYALVFSTLAAWLRDFGISRTAIGFFAWVGVIFAFKFVIAPFIDAVPIPWLTRKMGKRRSWMLVSQIGLAIGLYGMANLNPQLAILQVALVSLAVAFFSASQDVVVDAYRIEAVEQEFQGAMAANYVFGYRVAVLISGAGALVIADQLNWYVSYTTMAAFMCVGIITTFIIKEPDHRKMQEEAETFEHEWVEKVLGSGQHSRVKEWFVRAVASPFLEFFQRNGRFSILLLFFVSIYLLSDIVMGIMANPFYLDLGFSKTDIAQITKVFGFFCTIAGAFLGGALVVRYGIMRPLILGACMLTVTNLLFAYMAQQGPDKMWLAFVISADNISGGLANSVFIAYLSSLVNQSYTATQYALFSSIMKLPGKIVAGFSGVVVDAQGYTHFFVYAAILGLPAIILAVYLWLRSRKEEAEEAGAASTS
ncbi:MFS transporter [Microbulbifer sp. CAU 1566]|uniref:AmpG family muropeptide MFS transporter n=1 Tax=Microbulbifer sp. CAU 1566 TaxID=2933269 RepID=UPI002005AD7E|nr:MFS transporter [Microbulbifer sp. CAU 1566]MCK7599172.1 MFS transporter [Microbulbifer sp. CAU 1566]